MDRKTSLLVAATLCSVGGAAMSARGFGNRNMRSADPLAASNRRVETRIRTE